jgi:hypothetical protein
MQLLRNGTFQFQAHSRSILSFATVSDPRAMREWFGYWRQKVILLIYIVDPHRPLTFPVSLYRKARGVRPHLVLGASPKSPTTSRPSHLPLALDPVPAPVPRG